jgi:hypothetical protein
LLPARPAFRWRAGTPVLVGKLGVRNRGIEYITAGGTSGTYPGPLQTGDRITARDDLFAGQTKVGFDNGLCTATFDGNELCNSIRNNSRYGHATSVVWSTAEPAPTPTPEECSTRTRSPTDKFSSQSS